MKKSEMKYGLGERVWTQYGNSAIIAIDADKNEYTINVGRGNYKVRAADVIEYEEIMLKKCPFCGSEDVGWGKDCLICENCGVEGPVAISEEEATELWNKRSVRECQCGEEDDSMHYVIYMSDDGVTVEEFFSEDELLECLHDDWFDDEFQIYEDIGDVMNMCDMPKGTMIVVRGEIVNPLSEEE